jgi:hemerythrin-like domain-containing protein
MAHHPFIKHLLEDHKKQRALGARLAKAEKPGVRRDLREKTAEEVLPHMKGEEASMFTYMRGSGDAEAREHALEAVQEHHVARLVLRELLGLHLESDVFSAKAAVLSELNEHHMQEEESTHFPWIEKHASKETLDGLFKDYEAAEKRAKRG